jgi:High potential iron-sulfur protein
MTDNITRRALVIRALIGGSIIPITQTLFSSVTLAESPSLDPNDPTAKALGYITQSTKPGEKCSNCSQFQGNAASAQGPCTIFPGKSVAAAGWCMTWVKKPA